MEKQRTIDFSKSSRRLLILPLLVSLIFSQARVHAQAQSQAHTTSQANATSQAASQANAHAQPLLSAKILANETSEDRPLYTNTDIEFKILIPGIEASEISVIEEQKEELKNVSLRAIKKSGDQELKATWIQVWYRFEQPGKYQLPDLLLMVGNQLKSLSFESLTVEENPLDKLPRIVIKFANGTYIYSDKTEAFKKGPVTSAYTGKPLLFTVYLQFAKNLTSFEWDLPKDSLFSKTRDYQEQTEAQLLPVADFAWEALESGLQTLPRMKMTVTALNGSQNQVIFPEFSVRFRQGNINQKEDAKGGLFADAFSSEGLSQEKENKKVTKEDCRRLAELYKKESGSLISRKNYSKERQALETELGITPWLNKKFYIGDFGISTGSKLFSIPEEGLSEVSYIESGNTVEIKEVAGSWLYVCFGSTEGWCKKDEVIVWTWETF